jgi:diguanylate cyclase (GGDEF)-like protein
MDVDDFKSINDTYGHHVGDQALRAIAQALSGALRSYDLCVRYAGDEFIVLLVDCSRELAEAKRLELQKLVTEIAFEVRPGRPLPLGASAGAAVYPDDGSSYESLLAVADQRMYRDKKRRHQGRRSSEARSHARGPDDAAERPAPPLRIA